MKLVGIFKWRWQPFAEVVVALPGDRAVVLVKSWRRWNDDYPLRVHAFCHVDQIARVGWKRYWLAHICARVRTLSLRAKGSEVEATCYAAEEEARQVLGE